MSTTITTRQIDPICMPLQMSVAKLMADQNGGSARGYLAVGGPLSSPGMAY